MKVSWKDILFWVVLTLSIVLLIWNLFGNSPTEFIALATLIFAMMLKLWSTSDKIIKLEMKFNYLAKDFKQHLNKKK